MTRDDHNTFSFLNEFSTTNEIMFYDRSNENLIIHDKRHVFSYLFTFTRFFRNSKM